MERWEGMEKNEMMQWRERMDVRQGMEVLELKGMEGREWIEVIEVM